MARKTISQWGWLTVYENWLGNMSGTPASDGTGSCSFDFGVDGYTNSSWQNRPTASGMTGTLLGAKSVVITDDASWADGATRRLFYFAGLNIYAKKSGSNVVLEITSDGGVTVTGTTLLSFGSPYGISAARQHASPYRGRVWVGSTPEIDGSAFLVSNATSANASIAGAIGTANGSFTVQEVRVEYTDAEEHIDASTLDAQEVVLNGDGSSYNDFPQASPSGGTPSTPRSQYVVEDPPDDDTTWIQSGATVSTDYRQCFATDGITMANVGAVAMFLRCRNTVNAKSIGVYGISSDGGTTNKEEPVFGSQALNTYENYRGIFYLAPDGSPWSQGALDSWEPGIRAQIGTDIVALRDTAIHCEAMGCDYISLAEAGNRRRALAQVV